MSKVDLSFIFAVLTKGVMLFFAVALFGYYIIARALITPFVRWLERRVSRGFVREQMA